MHGNPYDRRTRNLKTTAVLQLLTTEQKCKFCDTIDNDKNSRYIIENPRIGSGEILLSFCGGPGCCIKALHHTS